jgi:hypothetical protein
LIKICNQRRRKVSRTASQMFVLLYLIILWLTLGHQAHAQSWKSGQQLLMKNNAKAAQAQLSTALKQVKSKQELAEVLKLLGVAHYMLGNKNAAAQAFQRAKAANPAVNLTEAEVLDESVILLFKKVAPPIGRSQATPARSLSATRQKAKKTLIKVESNVTNSTILIDGIASGKSGDEIDVDPGVVEIQVVSPGYRSVRSKLKVEKNTTSLVKVTLEKIQPKPAPKKEPVTKSSKQTIPLPDPGDAALALGTRPQQEKKKNSGGASLFVDEPKAHEFAAPMSGSPGLAAPQASAPTPYVAVPPPPAQPVAPPIQSYPAPMYQQPVYQQPMYQQPMYGQPAYPSYAAPYQQPYPQPYMPYAQPAYGGGYLPPPPAPYGYPQQPQQPPAPPPSVYQPYATPTVSDPYGGYLGPPPEEPVAPEPEPPPTITQVKPKEPESSGMPPPPRLPPDPPPLRSSPRSPKSSAGPASSSGCSAFIKILPFGAGQFCNGSMFKGLVFLGGEAAALFFFKSNSDAAASFQTKLNNRLDEREIDRETISSSELEDYDAETDDIEAQGKKVIAQAQQNATYSIAAFAGLYGLGVIDAFMNEPAPKDKSKTKKSRRKKPRIINSYNLDIDMAPMGTYALVMPYEHQGIHDLDLSLGYTPIKQPFSDRLHHAIVLGITWEL